MGAVDTGIVEWGVANLRAPGQAESGDLHIVASFPNGVLVAVIDGLGHGCDAAAAARAAATTLVEHAGDSMISLVRRCHEQLQGTRGAVMTLASFNSLDNAMTWIAVGNVEAILMQASGAREGILLRGGVVGYQLPPLRASVIPVTPGDTLILATDGIRGGFADTLPLAAPPQRIADDIITLFNRGTDDALVLVARWLGGAP